MRGNSSVAKKIAFKKPASGQKTLPKTVDVHYIKTLNYRSYHADGIFGGLTPSGKVYMEFFIQRLPTPQVIEYNVTPDRTIGDEVKRTGKKGFIREIEAGLVMDISVAKILKNWLEKRIEQAEKEFGSVVKDNKDGE